MEAEMIIKKGLSFEMAIGEIKIFHDTEKEIYFAKWGKETMPFHSEKMKHVIAMSLGAQWGSKMTIEKCANFLNKGN